jgi:DNA-binding NtrC family response regulator
LPHAEFSAGRALMAAILIVEDEIFIRQSAEWTMEDLGHDIHLAANLAEALVHLSKSQPIDALFVDIRLNELSLGGYDVADQAIVLRPELRVLYTSGSPLTDAMEDRFVGGGQFIQKPYSPTQLGVSVEALLQQAPGRPPGHAPVAP